ncbi:hypothetical protein J7T55_007083 [Diaporthe amygdali]|uniref:uncharacterized protein n=1 Tax=Phomopsis amygdali TaxID=1214568 RepID=UPI0022FEA621|nr:uncharacterized protein J7T55_007083 [Diaporthe amygdali]KAJ0107871.1 hypothetical protein J7T55_007083 [Diaporthe amygdali]
MAAVRPHESGVTKGKINRRNNPKSSMVTIRPEVHDARSNSKPKLPKPLTPRARRIITKKTSALIRKRNELDRVLLLQAFRSLDELSANDWLPREEILRQCEHLAKREKEYIRTRTKALDERTAFYNQDPSEERAIDLDLIRTQLWKFKRHLGPYLEAAEEPESEKEVDISSSGSDSVSSDEENLVQSKVDGPDSSDSSEDEEKPAAGLDGAFDDIRNPKKRKRTESSDPRKESGKESQKKARKEQTSANTQSTTSKSQSDKKSAPVRSKEMEASLAQIKNDIKNNTMSQTNLPKIIINGASKAKGEEGPVEANTDGTSDKVDRSAQKAPASSRSTSSASDEGGVPFYQRHAKAMMQPDFNDLVYDRPQRRRGPKSKQKSKREYLVSGALPAPHRPRPRQKKTNTQSSSADGP